MCAFCVWQNTRVDVSLAAIELNGLLRTGMPKRGHDGAYVASLPRQRLSYTSNSRRLYTRRSGRKRYSKRSLYRTGGRYPADAGELKDITNNFTVANCFTLASATGQLNLLNGCAQGTAANQRLGRRTINRSILIRIALWKSASGTNESPLRFMIVQDLQSNATAPAATDILQTDNIGGLTNLNNSNRFKIIMDKEFRFGSVDNTSVMYKKYIKCKLPTQFNSGSAGTVGDIQTGSIYLLTYSPLLTTALPGGLISTRVRYSDN